MLTIDNILNRSTPLSHTGGVTFHGTNVLVEKWIACWDGEHPLLDIGCGNCDDSLAALKAGAVVCATDMDSETVNNLKLQYKDRQKLNFYYAHLPGQIPFQENTFSGILCSEVFHFLDHAAAIATIWDLHRLLIPGGKAVITCASEDTLILQHMNIKEAAQKRREHAPHLLQAVPDYVNVMHEAMKTYGLSNQEQEELLALYNRITPAPYHFNLYNPAQLAMVFERIGFNIELATTGPADQYPIWDHGEHDQVRIIAKKPILNN